MRGLFVVGVLLASSCDRPLQIGAMAPAKALPTLVKIETRSQVDGTQAVIEWTRIKAFEFKPGGALEIHGVPFYRATMNLDGTWNHYERTEEWKRLYADNFRREFYPAQALLSISAE